MANKKRTGTYRELHRIIWNIVNDIRGSVE